MQFDSPEVLIAKARSQIEPTPRNEALGMSKRMKQISFWKSRDKQKMMIKYV